MKDRICVCGHVLSSHRDEDGECFECLDCLEFDERYEDEEEIYE